MTVTLVPGRISLSGCCICIQNS
ncbi:hypothetical protein MED222_06345 [Vibrio sp. MED222]|nr:hypothetical protein MED222_06345 [Vibrio sp. MED222]